MLNNLLFLVILSSFITLIIHFVFVVNKKPVMEKLSYGFSVLSFLILLAYVVARGIVSQRLPLANQFEFAISFALGIDMFYLLLRTKYKKSWYGTILLPIIFLMTSYAYLLPSEINELMPALRSQWFGLHIVSAILSYSAFAISFGISIKYLIDERKNVDKNELVELDYQSYKFIGFGYLMLTVVILSGCIWAEQAWSRIWSWDPKETWALITWIIYSIYLHQRMRSNWKGRKMALIAIFAFIFVIFTFVGVNTLMSGLHSYK